MEKQHQYSLYTEWTGNTGKGTAFYKAYSRSHRVTIKGKPEILCSADVNFLGEPDRYNPEELLLASLANCHMLWYLHLCAEAEVIVTAYTDTPAGVMIENADGSGSFANVTLYPKVTVESRDMMDMAQNLHKKANSMCFIANSCSFPVLHQPEVCCSNSDE